VAELTLKLFGNATEAELEYILEVVEGLLEMDMREALGAENGLIGDLNTGSTETDDPGKGARASKATNGMTVARKIMISLLTVAVVAFIVLYAYRRSNRQKSDLEIDRNEGGEEGENIEPNSSSDREHLFGA